MTDYGTISHQETHLQGEENKYLTFSLADEEYGIDIHKVKEIIGMMHITTMPQAPPFFKGVINLRGKVIPVIDLRLKFALEASDYTERTCIIVVEITGSKGDIMTGLVVDTVSEVLNIKGNNIEDAPSFGHSVDTQYIKGMAKCNGNIKMLLDIDKALSAGEIEKLTMRM